MKNKGTTILSVVAALATVLCITGPAEAGPSARPNLQGGGAPTVVSYQGRVMVDGSPHNGDGYFKFAIVNAEGNTSYWSNDGTSESGGEPTDSITLTVTAGLFSVLLGDTELDNMTELTAEVFDETECYLRVWFSVEEYGEYQWLDPDRRIAAVPYALQAQGAADSDTVDGEHAGAFANAAHTHAPGDIDPQGMESDLDADTVDDLHASELGTHYRNVVIVAKSGGDYTSVQTAIDSITDAAEDNLYLVWVVPGVYVEQVTMKPYVHLQGAGQEVTIITSTVTNVTAPPSQATLVLTRTTSLRDLTVGNGGTGSWNVALLATVGTTRTLVADMTARAQGNGEYNCAIFLIGSGTGVTLQRVTALAESGSSLNYSLYNTTGAAATLYGGSFTARGGSSAYGIYNAGSGTTLEAESVTALAENGSGTNYDLYNYSGAAATLRGGSFTARGGTSARGIYNGGNGTTLEATNVAALAENGGYNYGLCNYSGAAATLRGGSFTARGGNTNCGIYNYNSGTTLEATNVAALAENGIEANYGLLNSGATAKVDSSRLAGSTYSLTWGGTVSLGVTQLDGDLSPTGGTLTCFQVYDGNYVGVTCP